MKLISMVDYVLEQNQTIPKDLDLLNNYKNIVNYAKFLSMPLTLGMFVPTDEENNIIEDPCKHNTHCYDFCQGSYQSQYYEALEEVIFEGFKVVSDKYKATKRKFIYMPDGITQVWHELEFHTGEKQTFFIDYYDQSRNIESIIKYNLTLTPSTITKYQI